MAERVIVERCDRSTLLRRFIYTGPGCEFIAVLLFEQRSGNTRALSINPRRRPTVVSIYRDRRPFDERHPATSVHSFRVDELLAGTHFARYSVTPTLLDVGPLPFEISIRDCSLNRGEPP